MNTAVAVSFVSIRNVQAWMIFQLSMAWNAWLENLGAVDVAGGGCANKHLTTSRYLRALSRYLHLTMSRYLHWLWWVDIYYLLGWPARAARCMHVYRVAPNCTPRCRGSSKISHQRSSQPHTWLVRHNSNMHAEAEAGDCKSLCDEYHIEMPNTRKLDRLQHETLFRTPTTLVIFILLLSSLQNVCCCARHFRKYLERFAPSLTFYNGPSPYHNA